MSTAASPGASRAASPVRPDLGPPMLSLDAVMNATGTPTPSIRPDDSITNDGRSVVGSITSERRKPRKLDIRSAPRQEVECEQEPPEAIPDHPTEASAPQPQRQRRKPRKLNRASDGLGEIREESIGGVALETSADRAAQAASSGQVDAAKNVDQVERPASSARRRPRKLNRDRSTDTPAAAQPAAKAEAKVSEPRVPFKSEIEALKDRVRELEAQVRELYERPPIVSARSPRRRGKGRKNSTDAGEPHSEELTQLQAELVDAQNQLAALKIQQGAAIVDTTTSSQTQPPPPHGAAAPRSTRSFRTRRAPNSSQPVSDDDEIEDIRRTSAPGVDAQPNTPSKAVTLSGSYKFRLPNNLDMKDVKALQDGVTSATNIAKTLAATRATTPRSVEKEGDGKSWGEWFGSYSQSIARIMHNVEAEAAMESTPVQSGRPQQHAAGNRRTIPRRTGTAGAHDAIVRRPQTLTDDLMR